MFTDETIKQLNLDKRYKKTNSLFSNLKYSDCIVKMGGGSFSLSVNFSPSVSVSVNFLKLLWIILRYYYITTELVKYRKKIVEFVLHNNYDKEFDVIRNSLDSSCKWLEYNADKLSVVKKICLDYLCDVDNRLLLLQYSTLSIEESEKKIMHTVTLLDNLFEKAINIIRIQQMHRWSYEYLLTQQNDNQLQDIIRRAMESGILTSKGREL